jgi:hypothetical protein
MRSGIYDFASGYCDGSAKAGKKARTASDSAQDDYLDNAAP